MKLSASLGDNECEAETKKLFRANMVMMLNRHTDPAQNEIGN